MTINNEKRNVNILFFAFAKHVLLFKNCIVHVPTDRARKIQQKATLRSLVIFVLLSVVSLHTCVYFQSKRRGDAHNSNRAVAVMEFWVRTMQFVVRENHLQLVLLAEMDKINSRGFES